MEMQQEKPRQKDKTIKKLIKKLITGETTRRNLPAADKIPGKPVNENQH